MGSELPSVKLLKLQPTLLLPGVERRSQHVFPMEDSSGESTTYDSDVEYESCDSDVSDSIGTPISTYDISRCSAFWLPDSLEADTKQVDDQALPSMKPIGAQSGTALAKSSLKLPWKRIVALTRSER